MLFRKKIQKSCGYCAHGTCLDGGMVLCTKKGFVEEANHCRKFSYDATLRIPSRQKACDFTEFEQEDFTL